MIYLFFYFSFPKWSCNSTGCAEQNESNDRGLENVSVRAEWMAGFAEHWADVTHQPQSWGTEAQPALSRLGWCEAAQAWAPHSWATADCRIFLSCVVVETAASCQGCTRSHRCQEGIYPFPCPHPWFADCVLGLFCFFWSFRESCCDRETTLVHVLASLTRAGLCCPLHLERGEHFSLCAIWVGNMDEVFAVFPGAVCMVSSKSTGPTVLQWQDHVCDAFALSSFGTFLPRFLVF